MPAKKATRNVVAVSTEEETPATRTKMIKLIIKNFRCIGESPVEVELDDIVILVGANNAGKSTILKAYEVIMSGGKAGELTADDFHKGGAQGAIPEIELHTRVSVNRPGPEWFDADGVVREKWMWPVPGAPVRVGYLHAEERWAGEGDREKFPWGPTNLAKPRRPLVHRITAFDSPQIQAQEIIKILEQIITEKVKAEKSNASQDGSATRYQRLLADITALQAEITGSVADQISEIEAKFSQELAKVFPGYGVKFDAKAESFSDKTLSFFNAGSQLLIGPHDGHQSSLDRQGGGTCRTLLWTALRLLKESGSPGTQAHVLLLDEPEICLHPDAVRASCDLLYSIPEIAPNWQIMATTHSPCFINFENPHTKIARVFRRDDGQIEGTTIFRPSSERFSADDREALKILNHCDPYLAEFFFGGRTIIVEGDTEYSCFRYVISRHPEEFRNLHIVRARGKFPIAALAKVLNQFGTPYSILHDSDSPTLIRRRDMREVANPAWAGNQTIRNAADQAVQGVNVKVIASLPNFEQAYLGYEAKGDKPYGAFDYLRQNSEAFDLVKSLLEALKSDDFPVPGHAVEWRTIEDLEAAIMVL